jgi:preprotein translocase SecE subunit
MFGIYKPEQGYWVRVLTAVCTGVIVLAAAAWAWAQAGAATLPARGYILDVSAITGTFDAGTSIELLGVSDDAEGTEIVVGTSGVLGSTTTSASTASIEIDPPVGADAFAIDRVERVRAGDATALVRARQKLDLFPLIYLQAGVAAGIILSGAIGVYWFVATSRRSVDFLINTDGEMRKVNWSTRKEVVGSTQVVIVTAFLIALFLFGVDSVFAAFFRAVGVLET